MNDVNISNFFRYIYVIRHEIAGWVQTSWLLRIRCVNRFLYGIWIWSAQIVSLKYFNLPKKVSIHKKAKLSVHSRYACLCLQHSSLSAHANFLHLSICYRLFELVHVKLVLFYLDPNSIPSKTVLKKNTGNGFARG